MTSSAFDFIGGILPSAGIFIVLDLLGNYLVSKILRIEEDKLKYHPNKLGIVLLSMVIGLLAFSIALYAGFVLTVTCNDGYRSPSIGNPGGCSWHGGVKERDDSITFQIATFIGLWTSTAIRHCVSRRTNPS